MKKQKLAFMLLVSCLSLRAHEEQRRDMCADTPNRVMCMLRSVDVNDVASQKMIALQIKIFADDNQCGVEQACMSLHDHKLARLQEEFFKKYHTSVDEFLATSTDSKTSYIENSSYLATAGLIGTVLLCTAIFYLSLEMRYQALVVDLEAAVANQGIQQAVIHVYENAFNYLMNHDAAELIALLQRRVGDGEAAVAPEVLL